MLGNKQQVRLKITLSNADKVSASFNAPQVIAKSMLTFQLTVTDNKGATHSATTKVTLTPQTLINRQ